MACEGCFGICVGSCNGTCASSCSGCIGSCASGCTSCASTCSSCTGTSSGIYNDVYRPNRNIIDNDKISIPEESLEESDPPVERSHIRKVFIIKEDEE